MANICEHMRIPTLFLLLLLSAVVQAAKKESREIIDANHFFSEITKEKEYAISDVDKSKSMVVLLKPVNNGLPDNKVKLTLSSGSNKIECTMSSYHDLCILDNPLEDKGKLKIQCEKLPCNVQWKVTQSISQELKDAEKVSRLYKLPKYEGRLIVTVYCQSVEVTTSNDDSVIALPFANSHFEFLKLDTTALYLIFENLKEEANLFLNINPRFKSCAKIRVTKSKKQIGTDEVKDILQVGKKLIYDIKDYPKDAPAHFDIAFHSLSTENSNNHSITITLTGEHDGSRQNIRQSTILLNRFETIFDLSYGFPKMKLSEWKTIRMELETTKSALLTEIIFRQTPEVEVEVTQFSFFHLNKGEKLDYKLIEEPNAEDADIVNLIVSKPTALSISKTSCKVKQGCVFSIEANEDIDGHLYIGVGEGAQKEILIMDFGNELSFTHKIKELETIYIKKKLTIKKAVQITINSPNILVYMSNTNKCRIPSNECYEELGNINRHFIYYPDSEQKTEVIFAIHAVDAATFTLTLILQDTEYVTLKESQPFVYLFDSAETKLKFKFEREAKTDVSFNLIAPLNSLDLIVANGKTIHNDEDALVSTQGYLMFKEKQIKQNDFVILIRKREGYEKKYVHFTLVASSKGQFIRLESGVTHYETLTNSKKSKAAYIFQYSPSEDYMINFYSHNTKEKKINIGLLVRALSQGKDQKAPVELVIDRSADLLELKDISEELCQGEGEGEDENCEIVVELKNNMDIEIDIAITLMTKHTILEVKDGIWQSFSTNYIGKTAHFYFIPRNNEHDVDILFKTSQPSLRLRYRLFYAADNDIDLTKWPFPSENLSKQEVTDQKKRRPVNHIGISKSLMEECWPNCVILISIIQIQKTPEAGFYSIMATNSIMEIPEKQKIDITLQSEESKAYLIDLKYALDIEQNIYFYIYHSIGLTAIYANVYTEKNDRVPDSESFDLQLDSEKEMIVPLSRLKEIIKKEEMENDINVYLYIVVQATTDSKISFEFAFREINESNEKLMELDTYEHVQIPPHSERVFYTPSITDFLVKIVREKGFPLYYGKVCENEVDFCLKEFQNDHQEGKQILSKVDAYSARSCKNCLYIFRIKTEADPADVSIHLQSKSAEMELVENQQIYDFTEEDETNSYLFYGIRSQEIFVNIHVIEGEINAEITDSKGEKKNKIGQNIISFVLPRLETLTSKDVSNHVTYQQSKEENDIMLAKISSEMKSLNKIKDINPTLSAGLMEAFGLSDKFIQLHVSIKSTNSKPSIYTISYSSGEREFELQDGLITDYMLEPKKPVTFYYLSGSPSHIYFTMSMQKATFFNNLEVTTKYCDEKDSIIDDDCWVDIKTNRPQVKPKSPHPTVVYLLPEKKQLAITMTYSGEHGERASLGINHQEIMILPFDVQFPFILHKNESISFLVELSNHGYIEIVTRKCDESSPLFSYTFDYDSFEKEEFTYESELGANPKSKFMSKVTPGTLYMRVKSSQEEQSIISIMVKYSEKKKLSSEILPGDKGEINYSIIDSTKASLTIKPPTCPDSSCPKFKYYLMSASVLRDLYTQLVCPSNFFSSVQFAEAATIKMEEIVPTQANGMLEFVYNLPDQISFVGIKASNGKEKQVFYKPIEVATLWGQLSRTSHTHKLTIASAFTCALVVIIICVRRNARQGYRPLAEE